MICLRISTDSFGKQLYSQYQITLIYWDGNWIGVGNLDEIGISLTESPVYRNFENNIKFDMICYSVKLPIENISSLGAW